MVDDDKTCDEVSNAGSDDCFASDTKCQVNFVTRVKDDMVVAGEIVAAGETTSKPSFGVLDKTSVSTTCPALTTSG